MRDRWMESKISPKRAASTGAPPDWTNGDLHRYVAWRRYRLAVGKPSDLNDYAEIRRRNMAQRDTAQATHKEDLAAKVARINAKARGVASA